jgi:hypothetical protein
MRREVLPIWGARPIEDIRKRDIIALVDGIADRGAKIMANRTLAHIKRLFRWAAGRDIIDSDPAAHVEKTAPETKRERVLTDDELAELWGGAEAIGYPFGPAIQLLTLTGARREEIFGLRWREVDLEGAAIRLPAERSKMKEGRAIPLSPLALTLLTSLPRFVGGDHVFGLDGCRPFANIGHAKVRLDRLDTKPWWPLTAVQAWILSRDASTVVALCRPLSAVDKAAILLRSEGRGGKLEDARRELLSTLAAEQVTAYGDRRDGSGLKAIPAVEWSRLEYFYEAGSDSGRTISRRRHRTGRGSATMVWGHRLAGPQRRQRRCRRRSNA